MEIFTSCCNSLSPSSEAACTLMCDGTMLDGSLLQIEPDEIKAVSYKYVPALDKPSIKIFP